MSDSENQSFSKSITWIDHLITEKINELIKNGENKLDYTQIFFLIIPIIPTIVCSILFSSIYQEGETGIKIIIITSSIIIPIALYFILLLIYSCVKKGTNKPKLSTKPFSGTPEQICNQYHNIFLNKVFIVYSLFTRLETQKEDTVKKLWLSEIIQNLFILTIHFNSLVSDYPLCYKIVLSDKRGEIEEKSAVKEKIASLNKIRIYSLQCFVDLVSFILNELEKHNLKSLNSSYIYDIDNIKKHLAESDRNVRVIIEKGTEEKFS